MRGLARARRDAGARTASAAGPRRAAGALLLAAGLFAAVAPGTASARWARIAASPSKTSPYYVCPQQGHRVHCAVVEDPTRGLNRRGPVAAGAITAGPEQETSPAVYGTGVEGGYSPADLRSAYGLPSTSAGYGQMVAIVDAYDDPNAASDLKEYRLKYGISECTTASGCFRKVDQTGGEAYPGPEPGWAREISLDLDMVSAICPNCHILLVEAKSNQEADMAAAENEATRLGATEISDSYLGPEAPEEAVAYEHPGVPIAAAGGDHGYGVEAPAAYPTVIAVGGTSLRPEPSRRGRGWVETVWEGNEATGSGCSHEPKPAWQTDSGCHYRTTNDVSAVADPNTPVSAYDSISLEGKSGWMLLGGTSASAPIVAAAMALASPYTRSFDGAHALYLDAATGAGFNDIVSGSNGNCGNYLCQAGPGYDGPSGLGSLWGAPEVLPPTPVTLGASSITYTEATVGGTVNPHGAEVHECSFEYGPTTSYGSSVACSSLPGPGTSPVPVSASIAGLTAGTVYHFRVTVGYPSGPGVGGDQTFATVGNPPTVSTGAPSSITPSSVILNAQVNPNGAITECELEYGATTSYGSAAHCTQSPGSGRTPVAVSAGLAGLTANATYHYRVAASSQYGTSYGSDQKVTLLPEPPGVLPPSVVTGPPSAITQTSATLNATVNPNGGAPTSCEFEFNSSETYVPCATMPGSQYGPVAVSASVNGLRPAATFRYRIVAGNASGFSYGGIQEFSTPPPLALEAAVLHPVTALAPLTPTEDPPAYEAELTGRTLMVSSNGDLSVRVRCPAGDTHCKGTVRLQTVGAVSATAHPPARRILTLATGSFTVGHAGVVTVKLRLSGQARGLLARSRVLRVWATVLTGAPSGPPHAWQTLVTLRSTAAKRARKG